MKPGENKEIYSKFKTGGFPDNTQLANAVLSCLKNGLFRVVFVDLGKVSPTFLVR